MFRKILIANRGEIACRIIRTARRMGIATVAVYSEPDARALHVREADEAVPLGGSAAAESYLRLDKLLEAVRANGAEAVHPGYGFLSERAAFAEALEREGVAFIGPPPRAIALMGDKIESKRLAAAAGVSTVPGHPGTVPDAESAVTIARDLGYPVMIKATAGGGGKGMRLAHDDEQVRDGFRSATNEARGAFGDERVFVEKAIVEPRHIEIQVFADSHGNVVHLGERECSIQRRHQKVIEEAPSPFLDAEMRAAMGSQAVALAKAVGYRSAGTVEFIVDQERRFYFLEMNTRLQVEHPVTEAVTGLDLVELMIRVAAGEPLPFAQADVRLSGAAIEARVYAEDPLRGFLPSTGRLTRYQPPAGQGIRVDTGVGEGDEISIFYDPMVAKLVSFGATRKEATDRMLAALDSFVVRGINHNLAFLAAIVARPRFGEGRLSTDFIPAEFPDGFHGAEPSPAELGLLVTVAAAMHALTSVGGAGEWSVLVGTAPGQSHDVTLVREDAKVRVVTGGAEHVLETGWRPGQVLFVATVGGRPVAVQLDRKGVRWRLSRAGAAIEAVVVPRRTAELAALMPAKPEPDLSGFLLAPMPGLLVGLQVAEGQEVKAGEPLAVIEAMKMENVLRAARDGTVRRIAAHPGDSLAVDQVILEFE